MSQTYYLAGGYGADSIAKSIDGVNWTPANNNPFSYNLCTSLVWNGTYWLAGGVGYCGQPNNNSKKYRWN